MISGYEHKIEAIAYPIPSQHADVEIQILDEGPVIETTEDNYVSCSELVTWNCVETCDNTCVFPWTCYKSTCEGAHTCEPWHAPTCGRIWTCLDGHTRGSSILWEPQSRILIAGDLVFNHQYPYGGDPTTNLPEWIEAIEFLIKLDPKITISGHGPLATVEDLKEIKNFLLLTNDFINKGIKDGLTSEEIANTSNFPNYYGEDRIERRKLSLQNWTEIVQRQNQK